MAEFDEAPEFDRLDWDDWNLAHITKHSITREQVEEAIASGATIARETRKNRFLVLGPPQAGRLLAVVIGPAPTSQAPSTRSAPARPADKSGATIGGSKEVNSDDDRTRPARTTSQQDP